MRLTYDDRYAYQGFWQSQGTCHLRIYQPETRDGLPVVIATELDENEGTSVTNIAEELATRVWNDLLPDAREGVIWIEHYPTPPDAAQHPQGDLLAKETFARVDFQLTNDAVYHRMPQHLQRHGYRLAEPDWKHITRAEVEELIGQPFAPIPDM